ncbi:unnamed protein product [Phytophthora fragariaefolia]|uniref:Unnamed protein product n=1 Tax=Phytophthora fragariaefolia TaxID=1490495 RepID=A0A9W6WXT9_9STRA|nr:unnamed protein product [Phytophthora fragariaefolia]
MLLDCGATTIYITKRLILEHHLRTTKLSDKSIRVKLGDNQIVEAELEVLPLKIHVSGLDEMYPSSTVVYAIPDEFDGILGIPFFEDMQPKIDWRGLLAKKPDSCRGAALETDVKHTDETDRDAGQEETPNVVSRRRDDAQAGKGSAEEDDIATLGRKSTARYTDERSSTRGMDTVVKKMFTMGVVDESGVHTKFITRKKMRKFLRLKTKSINEPDFMSVLSNETIKNVARSLQRQDQPDNVGSAKAHRYLETDWDSFRANPAFKLLTEYKDNVFRPELPEGLPEKRDIEHRIDVKDPNLAMFRLQWRQSPEQQREIVHWVEDMVKKKLIRPSIGPHAAPTFCVRKPVGWRIVHDYRYLNSNTVRQSIPMTRKIDILDAMSGAYWFSTMDLMSAYYQVRMREEDIKFTAFQAPNGLWGYLVLPMGVCNAPATMYRLTSKLFRDLKNTKSFYDDIYIFTKSARIEDHLEALRETLDILRDNKLQGADHQGLACAADARGASQLLGTNGLRTTVLSGIRIANRDHVHPPEEEDQAQREDSFQRRAVEKLQGVEAEDMQHARTSSSRLQPTDASPDRREQVRRWWSAVPSRWWCRTPHSVHQPKDEISGTQLSNAATGVVSHRSCPSSVPNILFGQTTGRGDGSQESRRLVHAEDGEPENGITDALSRRPDLEPETKFFHDLSVRSFDDTSFTLAISEVTSDSKLISRIKKAYEKDRDIQTIFAAIKRRNRNSTQKRERHQHKKYRCYSEANGLLWHQTPADDAARVVVPNEVKLRQSIISECRDTNYGGHPGAEQTYLTLARHWCWSKMLRSIQKFIADCEPCRRNKPRLTKPPGLLEPLSIPGERWRSFSMDFITDLPRTKREVDSIWVVVDRLTKRCHFVPTTKNVTAEGVARLFIDNIGKLHGMPTNIVSDRDRKFVSAFWQHVFKSIGTKLSMSVAHRAQGDGQMERMDRTLEEYLRCFVGPLQDDWDIHLANAEFAVNLTVNSSTKLAPFEADLGYVPLNPLQLAAEQLEQVPKSRRGSAFREHQAAILLRCREALAQAQERMRDIYDRNRVEQVFDVGDRLYLSTEPLDPKHTGLPNSTKFEPKWIEPYTVIRKIHNHAYELNIQTGNKLHPVFNTSSLKPYNEPSRLSRPNDVILADAHLGKRRRPWASTRLDHRVRKPSAIKTKKKKHNELMEHKRLPVFLNGLRPAVALSSAFHASSESWTCACHGRRNPVGAEHDGSTSRV